MTRVRSILLLCLACVLSAPALPLIAAGQAQTPDKTGCKDHPLFTRMQGMRIVSCNAAEFDRVIFKTGKAPAVVVEGRRFDIRYQADTGVTAPSPVAIKRNHQQAVATIGGSTHFEDPRFTLLKMSKDGKEIWAQVDTAWGRGYVLTIAEKQAMAQEVVASAEFFQSGLTSTGHVEVQGIFFDTGKSDLKPESEAAVAEIAKLLKADMTLKVFVVGHTDNVAALDLNIKLSQSRADAVVQAPGHQARNRRR